MNREVVGVRKHFSFKESWASLGQALEPSDRGAFYAAIVDCLLYERKNPTNLSPIAKKLFAFILPELHANQIHYKSGKDSGKYGALAGKKTRKKTELIPPATISITNPKPNPKPNPILPTAKVKPIDGITSKNGLVPCTEEELRCIADTKNFSLSEVRRIHDIIMLKIADGIFQKKGYGKTVYFTLMNWVGMEKKRLQESGGGGMGRMTERDAKIMLRRQNPHLNLYADEDLS